MRRLATTLVLLLVAPTLVAPAHAHAQDPPAATPLPTASPVRGPPARVPRDCPAYWQDRPLHCAWGYLLVAPAGLLIPPGDVRDTTPDSTPRLGYDGGAGLGIFRALGTDPNADRTRVGIAAGLRFDRGFTRERFDARVSRVDFLRLGPELRLGVVRPRLFAFAVLRGGHARWQQDFGYRLIDAPNEWRGGFIGGGGGAWARLAGRFLLGGEAFLDRYFVDYGDGRTVTVSLSLGLWL